MNRYREYQVGWVVIIAMTTMLILLSYLFLAQVGSKPMGLGGFLLATGIQGVVLALMHGMRTVVGDGKVIVSFGIGLIKRSIPGEQIKEISIVKNPWYYGWGVRMIPNGWLYNVSGSSAVELQLRESNRVVRIGSKDPKGLAEAIGRVIGER